MKDIATTLETKAHLNFYENYHKSNTEELAKAVDAILIDVAQIEKIKTSDIYRHNIVDMAQFIYSKYLSERKAELPTAKNSKKRAELFSEKSLENLYSLAA